MDFKGILLTVIIYLVLFILMEKVIVKEEATFKFKIGYASIFFALVLIVNVTSRLQETPPLIGVTVFQISFTATIVLIYIFYEYFYNHKNK